MVEVIDDHPASTTTGAAVAVGGSSTGTIEKPGDADWFVVELIEGNEYRIDLEGWRTARGSLEDPFLLGIHDLDGELIPGTANDDGGTGLTAVWCLRRLIPVFIILLRGRMRIIPGGGIR